MYRPADPQENTYTQFDAFPNAESYLNLLESVISGSEIGVLICDADCNVIKLNPAQVAITKQAPTYNLGRNMRDIEIDDGALSATLMVHRTKRPVKIEQHLNNGQSYLVYSFPCFDKSGQLQYIVSNLLDTTEIYETQRSLEADYDKLSVQLQELQNQIDDHATIIHQSRIMRHTILLCDKVAEFDSTVLLQGESGVGKEKFAEYIFQKSQRCRQPFIKLNCASIPESLMESELFGYESGSFTGASKGGKRGLLDHADKGTLLLDEISELSLPMQAKLLRFLQEGEFYRIGGQTPVHADVRIIAASNKALWQMVAEKQFRADLYYRLSVIPITIPPLRERTDDIPLLIGYFTQQFNRKYGLNKTWSIQAIEQMVRTDYPGNVRELKNVVERALILSERDTISETDVFKIVHGLHLDPPAHGKGATLKEMLQTYEREILQGYFHQYRTEEAVAQALGSSQSTISRKRIQYCIDLPKNK